MTPRPCARLVADAVLYEGYLLYPYRPPRPRTSRAGSSACSARRGRRPRARRGARTWPSQCLLRPDGRRRAVTVHLRFLQLQRRPAERATPTAASRRSASCASAARVWTQLGRGGRGRARAGHRSALAELRRGVELPVRGRRAARTSSRCRRRAAGPPAGWPLPAAGVAGRRGRRRRCCRLRSTVTQHRPDAAADKDAATAVVADRRAPAAGGRRRAVRLGDRPAGGRARPRPRRCAQHRCWPVLAGDGGRRADLGRRAGVADHPVRPPRGRRRRAPARCSTPPRSTRS